MDNSKAGCYCCTAVTLLVLTIIVLFMSASTVEPISYGLVYNRLSKNVDNSTVYEGGWYLIGPLSKFIQYPRTVQNVDMSDLPGSDQTHMDFKLEGAAVKLHLSIQYQIVKESIPQIYSRYTDNFKSFETNLINQAKESIRQLQSVLQQEDFWLKRKETGDLIKKAIDNVFANLAVKCVGVQILKLDLSDSKENALIQN